MLQSDSVDITISIPHGVGVPQTMQLASGADLRTSQSSRDVITGCRMVEVQLVNFLIQ